MTDVQRPTLTWLRGLGSFEWAPNDQPFAVLLEALVRDRAEDELLVREMEATSRVDMGELHQDRKEIAEADLERARGEVGTFRTALEDAWRRGGDGGDGGEVPYDSANPVENAQVDALIQYVVRPDYGEVRTEEPQPNRFVYHVRVDWPRLRALGEAHGHPLPL
jgi:hypothetical protein